MSRIDDLVAGEVRLGPETVHVDVTNGCNTNCITCWDHSPLLRIARPSAWKRQRLDAALLPPLLDDIMGLGGMRAVILSGMGEPFTHPDIYQLIAEVKARGLHLTIITNLVAADPDQILELGVDELLVGVHGASERAYLDFHPSFRPAEWARLHAMLARFTAAGRRFKHVHVICAANAGELVEMVRQGARYRARQINFKLASLREGTEAARIDEGQRAALLDTWVPAARAEAERLGVETNLDVLARQLAAGGAETAPIADIGCFMGWTYSRITVDGTVLYCCNTEVVVGSLAGGARFSTLWHGEAWSALRARFRRGDYLPSCGQCGKLNQNLKIRERIRARHGDEAVRAVTGGKR